MPVFIKKIINAYREGELITSLKLYISFNLKVIRYIFQGSGSKNIVLHMPDYVKPSKAKEELEIVERIFQSYKKMKEEQRKVHESYLPSSLWQQQINVSYAYLLDAIMYNNFEKFHFFISNFGSWEGYLGLEYYSHFKKNNNFLLKRYFKDVLFLKNFKNWQWLSNKPYPVSRLTYPQYGNQTGAFIDKNFVGVGSFFDDFTSSILKELIDDVERPVIAELGAGYGRLAYFILRDLKKSCYVDFDLPETLCLASYFLMKTWPDKKVLLFGEEGFSEKSYIKYDLIFMPSWEIEKVGHNTTDLFLNKNSLGEMNSDAVKTYLHYITSSTKYFFHMNHEKYRNIYSNNSKSLLGYEYPLPKEKFKQLFRYPDIGHMLYQGLMDKNSSIFLYLYERRNISK